MGGVDSIRLMGLRGFSQTMNHFPQISMSAAIKNPEKIKNKNAVVFQKENLLMVKRINTPVVC